MRIFIVSALLCCVGGCGASSSYARVTAGRIGCPASEIELDEIEQSERGPESWVASCGRSSYVCSSNVTPDNPRARITCSELGKPAHSVSTFAITPRAASRSRHPETPTSRPRW